ncbi:acyltransferase [Neobacillus niacini]|uniref:acyltransferase family protein n=1 Tax=Neobacillus niacini TaxID=86668 RepID=UPI002FFFBE4D
MGKRYYELDSLRGIAAITVIFGHFYIILPTIQTVELLNYTPLRVIKAGHEAVLFFFVLSGFVLSLPFYKKGYVVNYLPYITKRFFRIYIPYIVAVIFAMSMYQLFSRGGIHGMSDLFNQIWTKPISMESIINHVVLIGNFDSSAYNMVIWSLTQEMRISIIFPLIMLFLICRFNWKISLVAGISLSILSLILHQNIEIVPNNGPVSTNYFFTLHYISMFIIGALLAKNIRFLDKKYKSLSLFSKVYVFGVGLLFYTYGGISDAILEKILPVKFHGYWLKIIADYGTTIGVALILIVSISSSTASAVLQTNTIKFFGKISYSLYLFHAIVLFTLVNAFFGKLPIWLIELITIAISIIVATISYYYVEVPSMKLGKYLANKWKGLKRDMKGKVA